jgi:hypothetical protein
VRLLPALTSAGRHSSPGVTTGDAAGPPAGATAGGAEPGRLQVRITDDGKGGAAPAPGSGLSGLVDRVAAVDGTLDVFSPVGHGTTVTVELPCGS